MTALDVLNEYKQYLVIVGRRNGKTLDYEKAQIIIDALKKQIATQPLNKTVDFDGTYGDCPCCKRLVNDYYDMRICSHCGQKLDWRNNDAE